MKVKSQRREEAEQRQKEYDKLTIDEKIKKLDDKLGQGVGAKKQRAKLLKLKGTVKDGLQK